MLLRDIAWDQSLWKRLSAVTAGAMTCQSSPAQRRLLYCTSSAPNQGSTCECPDNHAPHKAGSISNAQSRGHVLHPVSSCLHSICQQRPRELHPKTPWCPLEAALIHLCNRAVVQEKDGEEDKGSDDDSDGDDPDGGPKKNMSKGEIIKGASLKLLIGIAICAVISDPMVDAVSNFSKVWYSTGLTR